MRVELRDICLAYDGKPPIIRDLQFAASSGDFTVVSGPSGCGKSSLLRLINRLQEPTCGSLLIDGRPCHEVPVTAHRRRVPYLQQTPVMVPGTVLDNLVLPFSYAAAAGRSAPGAEVLQGWLDDFLLDGVELDADAEPLSVGQKQRLAFIRALLTDPEILLCDEPTSALDEESGNVVRSWMERAVAESGKGVVLVEHARFVATAVTPRRFRFTSSGGLEESAP